MLALATRSPRAPRHLAPRPRRAHLLEARAGYLPVKNGAKQLFYWYRGGILAEAAVAALAQRRPGCSSLGGMFTELGPFVVDASMNVSLNPWSWNKSRT